MSLLGSTVPKPTTDCNLLVFCLRFILRSAPFRLIGATLASTVISEIEVSIFRLLVQVVLLEV